MSWPLSIDVEYLTGKMVSVLSYNSDNSSSIPTNSIPVRKKVYRSLTPYISACVSLSLTLSLSLSLSIFTIKPIFFCYIRSPKMKLCSTVLIHTSSTHMCECVYNWWNGVFFSFFFFFRLIFSFSSRLKRCRISYIFPTFIFDYSFSFVSLPVWLII